MSSLLTQAEPGAGEGEPVVHVDVDPRRVQPDPLRMGHRRHLDQASTVELAEQLDRIATHRLDDSSPLLLERVLTAFLEARPGSIGPGYGEGPADRTMVHGADRTTGHRQSELAP